MKVKHYLAVAVLFISILSMAAACGAKESKQPCDTCGKEAKLTKMIIADTEFNLCANCENEIKNLQRIGEYVLRQDY